MTDFKTIAIVDIKPDPNQPRKIYDEAAMAELTESIKEKGILQPILIRPNGNGYLLVCGERRYRAGKEAGLTEMPAVIRKLTDDEALELQIIENLQRKDVHPMEEAVAFKSMLDNKNKAYTIADIAAKVHKTEAYISQRLSLNSLIPELQKEFLTGKFLTGHAILFSRLSAEDQKLCQKDCKEWGEKGEYRSVKNAQEFISRNIMRVLSSAPFKKDDATLNPAMGPCTTCPFRSGNNPTLFAEVKETDRCFKPACFNLKNENWAIRKVESLLVEEPEIFLLANGHDKILTAIATKAKEFGVKIMKSYDDFSTYGKGPTVKGFWVNGNQLGQVEKIYLSKQDSSKKNGASAAAPGKASNSLIDSEIDGIKQRTKRAAELDDEKVWMRIHKEIIIDKLLVNENTLSKVDTASVVYAMAKNAGYSGSDKIKKIFGGGTDKQVAKKMMTATPKQFNQACRLFVLMVVDSTTGSHTTSPGQGLLKLVAEQYHKEKITAIELEQKERRIKREDRAAQRIKALQEQKKVAEKPKPTKNAKSANKKA